ncbi:MAG: alpha/beta hydrolase-fold protein [Cyclonatronaceae bacterium]
MKRMLVILLLSTVTVIGRFGVTVAQNANDEFRFSGIEELMAELNRLAGTGLADEESGDQASMQSAALNELYRELRAEGHIPFTEQERVLFLYKGDADRVQWRGDFNRWGNGDEQAGSGTRIGGSDMWYYELDLPCDARVDYKIVLNGSDWIIDPANSALQWGGAGPNSELAMPCYDVPQETIERYDIERGTLSPPYTYLSSELGYEVTFYIYFPQEYRETSAYPVVYVTDGHEYADDNMGKMVTVLDNAIADSLIPPVMAVFIDPRDPYTGENRRQDEFVMNRRYAAFLAGELVPGIDDMFATSAYDGDRALMGTSLGGINTAYTVLNFSQTFGRAVIHSPAFWMAPELLDAYRNSTRRPVSMYISAGTINDGLEQAAEFRDILSKNVWHMRFEEVNQGHSWGQWKGQILPALIFFWGKE